MEAQAFNPSTWEAEAGRFLSSRTAWSAKWVRGQPGLYRETVSRKTIKKSVNLLLLWIIIWIAVLFNGLRWPLWKDHLIPKLVTSPSLRTTMLETSISISSFIYTFYLPIQSSMKGRGLSYTAHCYIPNTTQEPHKHMLTNYPPPSNMNLSCTKPCDGAQVCKGGSLFLRILLPAPNSFWMLPWNI